ncbi:hypothetical protein C6P45_000910 [Maudiozyma exigua]|uniref:RING-type domain-containing protein n=1 Tax=Maudiozyma exigua TaxID=34358 RepID=A0A9P6W633_MAUEX|nr:hypothetical protein C6P45_000910 [Kazachstania exigua]
MSSTNIKDTKGMISDKDTMMSSSNNKSDNSNKTPKGKQNYNKKNNKQNKNGNLTSRSNTQNHSPYHGRQGQYKRKQNSQYRQLDTDTNAANFNSSIEDEIVNGNFKLRGRRTQVSIKHLLDFNLPEIERNKEDDSSYKRVINKRKNQNKEHIHLSGDSFINVNSRFLVKQNGDYKDQMNDPNVPLLDSEIVRVVVSKGQSCPICLNEEPVAPRMVACGHVFCASCLINFFSMEETITNKDTGYKKKKKYKDCPLCGNIIRPQIVKDVMFEDEFSMSKTKVPTIGTAIDLKLMCKPHGHLLPVPTQLNTDPAKIGNFPNFSLKDITPYCHIMKCSTSTELELLQKDIDCINTQYEIDQALFNEDKKYVNLAVNSINDKIATILSENQDENDLMLPTTKNLSNLTVDNGNGFDLRRRYSDSNAFYFYETGFDSTTKFYLSHLDIKILLSAFKSYDAFPDTLNIQVENIHYGTTVTEQLIKRFKYIGHLPLGTELAFIDIDWRNMIDIIPPKVYEEFATELKNRRRHYNRRKQKEDLEKKMYQQKLEEDQMRFYQEENGTSLSLNESSVDLSEILNSSNQLDSLSATTLSSISQAKSEASKKSKAKKYEETTIWGTSISVQQDEKTSKENQEFEEMLLQRINDDNDEQSNSVDNTQRKGKKKKKGKVLLFST